MLNFKSFFQNSYIVGNIYLFFSFLMFLFAGILILGVRLELYLPGLNIMSPDFFNSLVTIHGLVMVFGAIMPAFIGIIYWTLPFMIFSKNITLYYINCISLLFLMLSVISILINFFLPLGNINCGWTLYVPLSIQMGYNIDIVILAVILISISSLINFISIFFVILKKFYINFNKSCVFIWTIFLTSYLVIIAVPILIGVMIMIFLDRHFKTSFFNPFLKGDPILYQHIFWLFGHPEVYIIIFPSFGIVSLIISVFSRKKIFGKNIMIYALIIIAILSILVWGHHMFCVGLPILGQLFFMYCTLFISIPTGLKIFNWLITIWRGHLYFDTPFLFCMGFIFFFIIGGLSGLLLSIIPLNLYYHGTYFVVAHFHYILVSCSIFSIYSIFYYWSPLIFFTKYNEVKGKIHFWLSFISFNLTFFPMHFLGFKGMPRRYVDYPLKYTYYNSFITFFSGFTGLSQVYFLYFILFPLILKC